MTIRLRPLSRQEIRQLDERAAKDLGIPTLILMENAGRGAASWFAELTGAVPPDGGGRPFSPPHLAPDPDLPRGPILPPVLVLCGQGNNGGDAGVVARHLGAWGFPVRVVWFARSDQLYGDAAVQWTILAKAGVDQLAWFDSHGGEPGVDRTRLAHLIAQADWLVDGLLGTGLSRPVEGPLCTVVEVINQSAKPVFALDLPSGLDADSGRPFRTAVRACATATFVAAKLGFSTPGARDYTGEVAVIDIGLPRCLLEPYLRKDFTNETLPVAEGNSKRN
jgi:NAD(P)H-hydrate epimerase